MSAFFRFNGHPPTKQALATEGESTFLAGVGEWKRGEPKAVTDELGRFLRGAVNGAHTVFAELSPKEFKAERAAFEKARSEADRLTASPTPTQEKSE